MNLTGRVYENKKIRTAATYFNPLSQKVVCRDVYISYKITILEKVGCNTYCYNQEVKFDIDGAAENYTITGVLQVTGKNLQFKGTSLWNSVLGPITLLYRVTSEMDGVLVNNCKLQLLSRETGWQDKPSEVSKNTTNYVLGTNTFCAFRKH